jgi:hypothetical protein
MPRSSGSTPLPHSRAIHVMFPAGSTLQQSDSFPRDPETWIMPLAPAEEIANLRVQLPIGVPFDDGRPWLQRAILTGAAWSYPMVVGYSAGRSLRPGFPSRRRHEWRRERQRSPHYAAPNESRTRMCLTRSHKYAMAALRLSVGHRPKPHQCRRDQRRQRHRPSSATDSNTGSRFRCRLAAAADVPAGWVTRAIAAMTSCVRGSAQRDVLGNSPLTNLQRVDLHPDRLVGLACTEHADAASQARGQRQALLAADSHQHSGHR